MLEYNTSRNKLVIREYGRNIQKMIEEAVKIEDPVKRNETAKAIVKTMSLINPSVSTSNANGNHSDLKKQRESLDYWQKLWDHLFIISDYQLEVDSPFEKPTRPDDQEKIVAPVVHQKDKINVRTYGRNLEKIIETVSNYPDCPEKEQLAIDIANQMKKLYLTWNADTVEDPLIIQQLSDLSNGKLSLPLDYKLMSVTDVPQVSTATGGKSKKKKKKKKRKTTSDTL